MDVSLHLVLGRNMLVSNFEENHLLKLFASCDELNLTRPVLLQSEMHPLLQQRKLRKFCEDHGILFQAYSPLGGLRSQGAVLSDVTLQQIATVHGRTTAQV